MRGGQCVFSALAEIIIPAARLLRNLSLSRRARGHSESSVALACARLHQGAAWPPSWGPQAKLPSRAPHTRKNQLIDQSAGGRNQLLTWPPTLTCNASAPTRVQNFTYQKTRRVVEQTTETNGKVSFEQMSMFSCELRAVFHDQGREFCVFSVPGGREWKSVIISHQFCALESPLAAQTCPPQGQNSARN